MIELPRLKPFLLFLILITSVTGISAVSAQYSYTQSNQDNSSLKVDITEQKSPTAAFVRSLVFPGWGHFYAGDQHNSRGAVHLGSDAALIGSIFGFNVRANRIENDFITFANLKAGIDLASRDRSFRLAVADFNSLDDYNDYQLRARNWNRLIEDTPENRWNWQGTEDRNRFREMRSDSDRIRSQIPALAGIMVVNRIISAISAYNRVQNDLESAGTNRAELTILPVFSQSDSAIQRVETSGAAAHLKIRF